jgi:uncharacterized protein YuzB (UPF0349 family)
MAKKKALANYSGVTQEVPDTDQIANSSQILNNGSTIAGTTLNDVVKNIYALTLCNSINFS